MKTLRLGLIGCGGMMRTHASAVNLVEGIKYEFVKTGKVFTRADFEPYAHMVL